MSSTRVNLLKFIPSYTQTHQSRSRLMRWPGTKPKMPKKTGASSKVKMADEHDGTEHRVLRVNQVKLDKS